MFSSIALGQFCIKGNIILTITTKSNSSVYDRITGCNLDVTKMEALVN